MSCTTLTKWWSTLAQSHSQWHHRLSATSLGLAWRPELKMQIRLVKKHPWRRRLHACSCKQSSSSSIKGRAMLSAFCPCKTLHILERATLKISQNASIRMNGRSHSSTIRWSLPSSVSSWVIGHWSNLMPEGAPTRFKSLSLSTRTRRLRMKF